MTNSQLLTKLLNFSENKTSLIDISVLNAVSKCSDSWQNLIMDTTIDTIALSIYNPKFAIVPLIKIQAFSQFRQPSQLYTFYMIVDNKYLYDLNNDYSPENFPDPLLAKNDCTFLDDSFFTDSQWKYILSKTYLTASTFTKRNLIKQQQNLNIAEYNLQQLEDMNNLLTP